MTYTCTTCGHRETTATLKAKCDCGGLWKLAYQPPPFSLSLVDPYAWNIFRYRTFMPLDGENWRGISLGEGMTPVIALNEHVYLKMDYCMPTLSFKDRGAAVLIAHCRNIGVDAVVHDSSGNAGNSVAAYCAKAGISCEIYVPESTSKKKIAMIRSHGARVRIIPGNREACAAACRERAERDGIYYASHVYNPYFYEGTKTYIYEVYEQLRRIPEQIFVPLGNGTLLIGVVKALQHLLDSGMIRGMPQIIAVQSQHCDPFAQAVRHHVRLPAKITPFPTLAEGIAIGDPRRGEEILDYIYNLDIQVITAPEERIMQARADLARKGIYCEPTTAATYAAYLCYCETLGQTFESLLPMCGAGLKSDK